MREGMFCKEITRKRRVCNTEAPQALVIKEWDNEEEPTAETKEMLGRKGRTSGRINSEKIIYSFLIEKFELYEVLEYAKFYPFVPEIMRIMKT